MATYKKINDLGRFADLVAVWDTHREGGREGDFLIIDGVEYVWDSAERDWVKPSSSAHEPTTKTIDGDLNVGGNLTVGGDAHVQGDVTIDGTLHVQNIDMLEGFPDPNDGQGIFKSIVFARATSRPATPRGGTFSNPRPDGTVWSDGIPRGTAPIWMSYRIFTSDGQPPQGDAWSAPVLMMDSDGLDIEFSPSPRNVRPAAPAENRTHGGTYPDQVWFDPQLDRQADFSLMNWMATRVKQSSNLGIVSWGAWAIVLIKGESGNDGWGVQQAYAVVPISVTSISLRNRTGEVPVSWDSSIVWYRSTNGLVVGSDEAMWMSQRVFQNNVYGEWSDPVRISGKGATGADGTDIEFIYKQSNRLPVDSDVPQGNDITTDDFVPESEGWYDEAKGVDTEHKYEWMCQRVKASGSDTWGPWSYVIVWSAYGDTGMDGASVQYIFKRTEEGEGRPSRPDLANGYTINEQNEQIPRGWSDDPLGVNKYYPKEWVSMRRKGEGSNEWGLFSEPALWATFSEEHTVEIGENGNWWIDGKDTGKQAEGKNGEGVALKGVVDFWSTSDTGYTTGKTTLQEVTGMEVGDCYVVAGGDNEGHLFVYNGGSTWPNNWTDLGEFRGARGPAGESKYIHIAWADEMELDSNGIATRSDFPIILVDDGLQHEWMGMYVDKNEQDSDDAKLYKWNYLRGADGTTYERVYVRSKVKHANGPGLNESRTYPRSGVTIDHTYDEYLPFATMTEDGEEGPLQYTDGPSGVDEVWPFEWMAERKKVLNTNTGRMEWRAFSAPVLWATYSASHTVEIRDGEWWIDGVNQHIPATGPKGDGIKLKGSFANEAALRASDTSGLTIGDCFLVEDTGHLWVYTGDSNDPWSDIGEIKGEPGDNGTSSYIHVAWAENVTFNDNTSVVSAVTGFTQVNAEGSTLNWIGFLVSQNPGPLVITEELKKSYKWNYIKGMDGSEIEYVYFRTATNDNPGVQNDDEDYYDEDNVRYTPASNEYRPKANNGERYTDDPHGVSPELPYEWMAYRRSIGGVWGNFRGPTLWSNWAESASSIRTEVNEVVVDTDASGNLLYPAQKNVTFKCWLYYGDTAVLPTVYSASYDGSPIDLGIQLLQQNNPFITISLTLPDQLTQTKNIVITMSGSGHTATATVAVRPNRQGANGTNGAPGPALRFRGKWDEDTTYTYNSIVRDCVKHGTSYWVLSREYNNTTTTPGNGDLWTSIGNLNFVATELLLAENGAIDLLSSNVINLFNSNGDKTASINADSKGSYCIYYSSGNKMMEFRWDGYIVYYNDDGINSVRWKIGKGGQVQQGDSWEAINLNYFGTSIDDLPTNFNGRTDWSDDLNPYYKFSAGAESQQTEHDGEIRIAMNFSSVSRIPDGVYSPNAVAVLDNLLWKIRLYKIVDCKIVQEGWYWSDGNTNIDFD